MPPRGLRPGDAAAISNATMCERRSFCSMPAFAMVCRGSSTSLRRASIPGHGRRCGRGRFSARDGDGTFYTPIVTDLWRRVQPILRYRLNDIVSLKPNVCSCGSRFRILDRIEGRRDDLCDLLLRAGGTRQIFPDIVRRMILLADPRIEDYDVVQERPGEFRIRVQTKVNDLTQIARLIETSAAEVAAKYDCIAPRLIVERAPADALSSAKRRRVRRMNGSEQ